MGALVVYDFKAMAQYKPPEIQVEFGVSLMECLENPPKRFPASITFKRRMGRTGFIYQRSVEPHELVSSAEAIVILQIGLRHFYRVIKDGKLKPKRVKDRLLFVSRDVQKLARKRGVHPIPENPKWEKKLREARRKGSLVVEDEKGVLWLS
jgi:hypothetical protein